MTYKILTEDTMKIIYRSKIQSAWTSEERNKRLPDPEPAPESPDIIKSKHNYDCNDPEGFKMPTFDTTSLIGRTFLKTSLDSDDTQ